MNENVQNLIEKLKQIESHYKTTIECTDHEKGMWFNFGSNDTLATTISDIEKDLNLPNNHGNRELLIDKMKMIVDLNSGIELMIYYS